MEFAKLTALTEPTVLAALDLSGLPVVVIGDGERTAVDLTVQITGLPEDESRRSADPASTVIHRSRGHDPVREPEAVERRGSRAPWLLKVSEPPQLLLRILVKPAGLRPYLSSLEPTKHRFERTQERTPGEARRGPWPSLP